MGGPMVHVRQKCGQLRPKDIVAMRTTQSERLGEVLLAETAADAELGRG